MLRRVVVNLVRNAVQAIRDERAGRDSQPSDVLGHVVVSAEAEESGACIVVEDDGPGIPEEMRSRVFDPYFTTKTDGTGLGLAIVKKIVVEHGGEIEIERGRDLKGARITLHLPSTDARESAAMVRATRELAIRHGVLRG